MMEINNKIKFGAKDKELEKSLTPSCVKLDKKGGGCAGKPLQRHL